MPSPGPILTGLTGLTGLIAVALAACTEPEPRPVVDPGSGSRAEASGAARGATTLDDPAAAAKTATVDELIDRLVEVDSFDTGLSASFAGTDFPPVAGQNRYGMMLLGAGGSHARLTALTRLVAMGPRAIRGLVRHLEDARPTRLVVKHESSMGTMSHAREVPFREGSKQEMDAIRRAGLPVTEEEREAEDSANFERDDGSIKRYEVTVGDVCFVILGMISNRDYNAVRYQPTACQIVNSPTKSPGIAKAVRLIWDEAMSGSEEDLREYLFQRMKGDFVSEGPYSEGAATRLLYYFPDRSGKMVRARLERLLAEEEESSWTLTDFIKAVAWSDEPLVRERLKRFVLEANDQTCLEDGALALGDRSDSENFDHLVRLADEAKQRSERYIDASRALLRVNLTTFPERRAEAVRLFMKDHDRHIAASACWTCFLIEDPPIAELLPCLEMKEEGVGQYLILGAGVVDQPEKKDVLDYRVCDNAYETIARALGDRECRCTGTRSEMDRRIETLRARLRRPPEEWRYRPEEVAARQREQNKGRLAKEAREARARQSGGGPTEILARTASDPIATFEEVRTACLTLVTPPGIEPPDDVQGLLGNHFSGGRPRLETLPDTLRESTAKSLSQRLEQRLADEPNLYPTTRTVEIAALLVRVDAERGAAALAKCTARIGSHVTRASHPDDLRFSHLLRLLDELIHYECPGADRVIRTLFETLKTETLQDNFARSDFLALVARHAKKPEIDHVLRAMFLEPKSKWHLSRGDYELAPDYSNKRLTRSATFRRALRAELEDTREVGTFTIGKEGRTGLFVWNRPPAGTSTFFVDRGGPLGIEDGKESMPIRHCDAWMHGLSGGVFRAEKTPAFRAYWPLDVREAARKRWIEFLKQ